MAEREYPASSQISVGFTNMRVMDEPDYRFSKNGVQFLKFRGICNVFKKGGGSIAAHLDLVMFGEAAERAAKHLKKGSVIHALQCEINWEEDGYIRGFQLRNDDLRASLPLTLRHFNHGRSEYKGDSRPSDFDEDEEEDIAF